MILYSLYALFATLSFGILFNIKGLKLFWAALGGGIGWFFYLLCLNYNGSKITSSFIASFVVTIFAEIMARLTKTPVTIYVICAIIPLVPGGGMYYTMYAAIQNNVTQSLNIGFETISIACAIAIGIVLVSSITKIILFWSRKKPHASS